MFENMLSFSKNDNNYFSDSRRSRKDEPEASTVRRLRFGGCDVRFSAGTHLAHLAGAFDLVADARDSFYLDGLPGCFPTV